MTSPRPVYVLRRKSRTKSLELTLGSGGLLWPLLLWTLWGALATVSVGGLKFLAYRNYVTITMAAVGLYWAWRSKHLKMDGYLIGAGVFVVYALISASYSQLPDYTFYRSLALVLMYLFTFVGIRSALSRPADAFSIYVCLLIWATLVGFLIVFAGGMPEEVVTSSTRYAGPRSLKATGVAWWAAIAIPLFLFAATQFRWTWLRFAFWLGIPMASILMIASRGRTGIISTLLVLPVVYAGLRGRRLNSAVVAGPMLVLGVIYLASHTETGRIILRLDKKDLTTGRQSRWEETFTKALERPLFGHGFATNRYREEQETIVWSFEKNREGQVINHNEHISLFYDLGGVGILFFWTFLAAVGMQGYRVSLLPHSPFRALIMVIFSVWLVEVLNTMSHDPYFTTGNPAAFTFWILGSVISMSLRLAQQA